MDILFLLFPRSGIEETKDKVAQMTIEPKKDGGGDHESQQPHGTTHTEVAHDHEEERKVGEEEDKTPAHWEVSQTDHLNKKLLSSFLDNTKGKGLLSPS